MLGPVIHTPLLDRISIQLQFTLGNTEISNFRLYQVENKLIFEKWGW